MDKPARPLTFLDDLILGLSCYYLTTLIVVLGVMFGHDFLKPPPKKLDSVGPNPDFITCFCRYDGQHYKQILEDGYEYDPERQSSIAFFPAYPLAGRLVKVITAFSSEASLLIVSHLFLAIAFVAFTVYLRQRFGDLDARAQFALLAFGLFPTTFFFRMAYSESMFVCLCILALLGMERRWPVVLIALLIGLATATRAAGVALVPPFALYLWQQSPSAGVFLAQLLYALPLSCWGFLAFTGYQWSAFDEPFAWAKAHSHWKLFTTPAWPDKLQSLLTLEPVWSMFVASSPRYWAKWEWHENPVFSLLVANPILFVFTGALIVLGAKKHWLTGPETLLSLGLLLMPYWGRGYENSMLAMGRFCAAAVPLYLVVGKLSTRLPNCFAILLLTTST